MKRMKKAPIFSYDSLQPNQISFQYQYIVNSFRAICRGLQKPGSWKNLPQRLINKRSIKNDWKGSCNSVTNLACLFQNL